jgi:hypothetical protein
MATQVQFRRGTTAQNNSFTGAAGEISVNTSLNAIRIHDGSTAGGFELAKSNLSNIASVGVITASTFVGALTGTATTATGLSGSPSITVTGVNASGVITATDFNATSDISLKKNIHFIDDPLGKVMQLNGVSFDWKETNKPSIGVIAQELEKVLPELVSQGDVKSVNYNGIIGVLIEAIKELKAEVEELKNAK